MNPEPEDDSLESKISYSCHQLPFSATYRAEETAYVPQI